MRGGQFVRFVSAVIFFFIFITLLGCAAPKAEPLKLCPGVGNPLRVLLSRSEKAVGIRASGRCFFTYYADGKKREENFAVKIWLNPPGELYLQGDIAFDQRGLVVGSNENEYWLWLRPDEISSYWWGRWANDGGVGGLILNPRILLEVFGMVEGGAGDEWSFTRQGDFYVVTRKDSGEGNGWERKLYLGGESCHVSRIEYLDRRQRVTAFAELDNYTEPAEGFFVPRQIRIVNLTGGEGESSLEIKLGSVRRMSFNERQRSGIFSRPQPKGFEHVYEIVNGDIIKQK